MAMGVLKAGLPPDPAGSDMKTSGSVITSFVSVAVSRIIAARNKAISFSESALIQSDFPRHVFKLLQIRYG